MSTKSRALRNRSKDVSGLGGLRRIALSDAILIAAAPVLFYGAVYISGLGYSRFFGPLTTRNIPMPIELYATMSLVLLFLLAILAYVTAKLVFFERHPTIGNCAALHFGVILILAEIVFFANSRIAAIFFVAAAVNLFHDVVRGSFKNAPRGRHETVLVLGLQVPRNSAFRGFSVGPVGHLLAVVLLIFLSASHVYSLSYFAASIGRHFLVLDTDPSKILASQNDDRYEFAVLEDGTQQLSNRRYIVKVTDEKPLILRLEAVGPIFPRAEAADSSLSLSWFSSLGLFLRRPLYDRLSTPDTEHVPKTLPSQVVTPPSQ